MARLLPQPLARPHQPPLATAILTGQASDISQGATHFYTPRTMPKEGEPTVGYDIDGGLESVTGVNEGGRPVRNYRPGWAHPDSEVTVSGVRDEDFKFYRVNR